jgi:hypothetical protein
VSAPAAGCPVIARAIWSAKNQRTCMVPQMPRSRPGNHRAGELVLMNGGGIRMVCPGHDDCFRGAGFMTYAMLTSPAAGKPPDPH